MTSRDSARVLAPPPLIYAVFLAAGYFGRGLVRWEIIPRPYNLTFGILLILGGVFLAAAAVLSLLKAKTALNPYHSTRMIVRHGVFGFSRNPIYLGMLAVYLGIALALELTFALLLTPLLVAIMHFAVIRREEKYLETKFGTEYAGYKAAVRRWI